MEIKRNIFESGARMPATNGSFTVPMVASDLNSPLPTYYPRVDANVRHAPIPRIGEQT